MTDTPLRRAARALMLSQSGVDDFDALDDEMQASLIEDVKAVLGALREPSFEMVSAAHNGPGMPTIAVSSGIWVRMIDAAIGEGQ